MGGEVIKAVAVRGMTGLVAGQRLPAADDRVDIEAIEFQPIVAPAGALGGDYRRAAAEKSVEDDVAARRAVEDRVGDHRHRLDGGMRALVKTTGEGFRTVTDQFAAM